MYNFAGSKNQTICMEKQWHVLYVKSRSEKKVFMSLTEKGIEAYLPLHKKLRQWSDRKKIVEMPLFSGYIFVNINRSEYDNALKTNNVVCYITFEGKAATIRNRDIEYLKRILNQDNIQVELTTENLSLGDKVEILSGPLMGLRGELIEFKGKRKVGIKIEQINYTVMIEIPISNLVAIP